MLRKFAVCSVVAIASISSADAAIVNIGHELGFYYDGGGSDPAPTVGEHINFIGTPESITLAAGTYKITNATGMAGANPDYTAWSYNLGSSSWAWAFVGADTSGNVLVYGDSGVNGSSQDAVADSTAVKDFSQTFTLDATTTVDFTLRDYYPADNGGGIALDIEPVSSAGGGVPEPASWALMLAGFLSMGTLVRIGARRNANATA